MALHSFFCPCDQSVVEDLSPVCVKMVELQLLQIFMLNDKYSGDNFLGFYRRAERATLQSKSFLWRNTNQPHLTQRLTY